MNDRTEHALRDLTAYALHTQLITGYDIVWALNTLLGILRLDGMEVTAQDVIDREKTIPNEQIEDGSFLEQTLTALDDYAAENGLLERDSVVCRDLFDTKLMGALTPRPNETSDRFMRKFFIDGPDHATDWFYRFSQDNDYIRRYRIKKDLRWKASTEYGDLDITINLSKPEKDPADIAAAAKAAQTGYPKCLLCLENEGYAGRIDHPARQNHRVITLDLAGEEWGFQYSPYVYYNEHCIVFAKEHRPMKISRGTFDRLTAFLDQFPHYFIGSNADLPIVGGSILSHDHFQGGNYMFPMAKAPVEREFASEEYPEVSVGIVKWPMSVIRLRSADKEKLIAFADKILNTWRDYDDADSLIFSHTEGAAHNTITPIARMRSNDLYEIDLVLRNNRATEEHPMGLFHPHEELHHIKKENIGLIEVMGLAVLPARLKGELESMKPFLCAREYDGLPESLAKHDAWLRELRASYGAAEGSIDEAHAETILRDEVGKVFARVLEDAGVYKRTPDGQAAFDRFVRSVL